MRDQRAEASTYRRNGLIGRQRSREGLPAFRTEAITRNSELVTGLRDEGVKEDFGTQTTGATFSEPERYSPNSGSHSQPSQRQTQGRSFPTRIQMV